MAKSYKSMKEDFVSNLSGGSLGEINQVTAVAPATYLLWSALQIRQGYFEKNSPATALTDFLLHVVCLLLATTLYSSVPLMLDLLLVAPAIALVILPKAPAIPRRSQRPNDNDEHHPASNDALPPLPTRPFVTVWRGGMLIITCLAILAVDFKVFPRRFAKVEVWGTSLMDVGVGSFVFSAGLVSARPILKSAVEKQRSSIFTELGISLRHAIPLLVLGVIRLYSVKGLDYAEHVTEYGVHWNFFFTLGLLPPFVTLFHLLSATSPTIVASFSFLLGGTYQLLLEITDLKAYILTAPRTDLLSQNREGVFSFSGYLAIFLAGQAIGLHILKRYPKKKSSPSEAFAQRARLPVILMMWSLLWGVLYIIATSYQYGFNLKVSRRLANLPYVLWVATFNSAQLMIFCLVETCCFPGLSKATSGSVERREGLRATPRILKAFNRNGLAIFLAANLLTGLINLRVDTLSMTQSQAMGILLSYAAVVTLLALGLDHWNFSIKL